MKNINSTFSIPSSWLLVFSCWVIATTATLTSLFFSEIVQLPVCVLCWYQRIAMYPLVLMLPLALFPFDAKIIRYAGVLTFFGGLIALFHVLLVAGYIPESAQPCVADISCSQTHLNLFGWLNMPMMSLFTFALIGKLLFYANTKTKRGYLE
mgnify:CR=1 FL=1|tara:strand:+ start:9639 stop:10094 length:456 start_codon:yes stop_codon:yes gene_type:complete